MFSSIKELLDSHPFTGITTSLGGYVLSFSDFLSPILRFLILLFSTSTAISVAYVHYNKARRTWYGKDSSKKDSSNS